jgi:hypothetical protein
LLIALLTAPGRSSGNSLGASFFVSSFSCMPWDPNF